MEAYSEHAKPPEKCLWRLLCHPNIWLWFHVASVQKFLCCHRICCFGRKYPKGYLYAELSSEHFLIGSKSAPQNAIVPLDSLMVMNKNKGQIPQGKTSLPIQDPPCHFWRTMPNSTLSGSFTVHRGAQLSPRLPLPWRMLGQPLSTLASAVASSGSVPAQNVSCTHCRLHPILWNASGILTLEENHIPPFVRTLTL